MVLADDNFVTIVAAVEEGRCIYDNIEKVIQYLLSCNLGEVLAILTAVVLGLPAPLLPIHLLWINLVTDGLPALALSVEPPEPGIMRRPPRDTHDSIVSWRSGLQMLYQGALVGGVTLFGFWWFYQGDSANEESARTAAFCVLVFAQLAWALAARSLRLTFWQLGLLANVWILLCVAASGVLQGVVVCVPYIRDVFKSQPMPLEHWGVIFLLALVPVTVIEITKLVWQAVRRPKD